MNAEVQIEWIGSETETIVEVKIMKQMTRHFPFERCKVFSNYMYIYNL